VTTH